MPFSWIRSQVLTTEPTLLCYGPPRPPPHITGLIQQPGSPPTSLHGKGHAGHTTCYLRKIWWIPEAGQAQSNYTPGETRHICWTLLEWHSVCLQALVRIHSPVHLKPRNVFEVHNSRWVFTGTSNRTTPPLGYEFQQNTVSSCSGNNKRKFSQSAHLWEIKCRVTADLQGWGRRAGLHLNKHDLAGGKLTATGLKVELSGLTQLTMMHSMYSQPVLPVLVSLCLTDDINNKLAVRILARVHECCHFWLICWKCAWSLFAL